MPDDLNAKLSRLREQRGEASEELMKLVGEADGKLDEAGHERHTELSSNISDLDGQIDVMERTLKVGPHHARLNDEVLSDKRDQQKYSITRLATAMANPGDQRLQDAAGFEREVSSDIGQRIKSDARGAYIPREIWNPKDEKRMLEQRTLVTASGDAGGYFVEEELRDDLYIGMIRNRSALDRAGATTLPGLRGDVLIPKQTGAGSFYWVGEEEDDVTESAQTIGQVRMSPKHGGAHTRWSRQTLLQSSIAIENFVRNDLARITALGIDLAGIQGSGDGGEPKGVQNTSGTGKPTAFAAAIPTWAELMTMIGTAAAAGGLEDLGSGEDGGRAERVNWLVEGQMYSDLMAKAKDAGSGRFVLEPDGAGVGRIGMWPVITSNQITAGDIWFGNFADLIIGTWGDPDLVVNPFTNDTSGVIRLTLHQFVDVAVRHAESFVYNNDT